MKMVLKVIAYIVDVALMPVRALFTVQIFVCAAILNEDFDIKDAFKCLADEIKQYPSHLKEVTKVIFTKG